MSKILVSLNILVDFDMPQIADVPIKEEYERSLGAPMTPLALATAFLGLFPPVEIAPELYVAITRAEWLD